MAAIKERSVWQVVAAVALVHAGLLALFLSRCHWDLSVLVQASETRARTPEFQAITQPLPSGHDGQFYYLIAQKPFSPAPAALLDTPSRHTRLLYPLLGWIASAGGDQKALLYALPLLNLLAAAAAGWLGAVVALKYGQPAWQGFFLPVALASGIALVHDLTDAVGGLLLAGLLAAALFGRERWIGPLALLALFAKEQNAVIVAAVGLHALLARRWVAVAGVALAGAAWLGWLLWVSLAYGGASPFLSAQGNFTAPFVGLWWRLSHLGRISEADPPETRRAIFHLLSIAHHLALVGLVGWLLVQPIPWLVRFLGAIGAAMVLCAGQAIYQGMYDYNRVLVMAPLAVWFAAVTTGRTWMLWSVAPGALWCLYAAMHWA